MQYNKYHIKDTDSFKATDFPKVQGEVDDITKALKGSPPGSNAEIILSYLKDHTLKKEWIDSNPGLTTLLTGSHFTTSHIEALFESCQKNKPFLKSFEEYIIQELAETK